MREFGKPLVIEEVPVPRPAAGDILVKIEACGVCHTDLHAAEGDWPVKPNPPFIPGHEGVGHVAAVGAGVTRVKEGDRVGVPWLYTACGCCEHCLTGWETLCESQQNTGYSINGGYAEYVLADPNFVGILPKNIEFAEIAPILCAGITTYSPLKHYGVKPGDKVGILGMGGLGHMGIKFAKALGAEVTLFTRSASKAEEGRRQGADHVIVSTDAEQMRAAAGRFDLLLDTIPVQHDLNPYLDTLRFDGVHILVGLIEPVDPPVHAGKLVMSRRVLAGSLIGGIAETQEVLDFCAEHNITCDIEMLDIRQINEAYARMIAGDVKYRFVIDMATLKV